MKYRAVYQLKQNGNTYEVVSVYPNDSNVVTTTGQKFLVDDLDMLVWRLMSTGVDISYFWKNDLINRPIPTTTEIPISSYDGIDRKAFVHSLNVDYSNTRFRYNTVVRHFDENGDHITDENYDDVFVSRIVDNSQTVDDGQGNQVPEYSFFFAIMQSGAYTLSELQDMRISIMDFNGVYDGIY